MNFIHKNRAILGALILAIIAVALFAMAGPGKSSIDEKPEGTDTDFSVYANLSGSSELLQALGSLEAYESVSRDLYVFGTTAYDPYKNKTTESVGFKVTSKIKKSEDSIAFEGIYGSSDHPISVEVTVLKNGRIRNSIKDKETSLTLDDYLPSNSKRNQFIGTLPLITETYSIDYDISNDGFIISLFADSSTELDKAYVEASTNIKSQTEINDLSSENIRVQRPGSSFGQ